MLIMIMLVIVAIVFNEFGLFEYFVPLTVILIAGMCARLLRYFRMLIDTNTEVLKMFNETNDALLKAIAEENK